MKKTPKIRNSIAIILYLLSMSFTFAHDWVNHIQSRLSDKQIKRDVRQMQKDGISVAQTLEKALREEHALALAKIKEQLHIPDDIWQEAMDLVEAQKQELLDVLYAKENIHNCSWFISDEQLASIQDKEERKQWQQLRIVAKNTLIDFGINPKNIEIYANDAGHLAFLKELSERAPSWWQRQKTKLAKHLKTWEYSFSPIWAMCHTLKEKPLAQIAFNISAISYFEPVEQRALFGHEVTHIIQGHLQEIGMLNELQTTYGAISDKNWRRYSHILELMADQLPALKNSVNAQKCYDAMFRNGLHWPISTICLHPLLDYFAPKFSTHPLTIHRIRAFNNIMRYLQVEQELNRKK